MKRILAALFGTVTGLVILLDFKTHPASTASAPAATSTTGNGSGASGSSSSSASSSSSGSSGSPSTSSSNSAATTTPKTKTSSTSSSTSSSKTGTKTYTGSAVDTQFGPVQVQITVINGKLTKADAIEYPNEQPRDQEINSYAIPVLDQETASAHSAKIDMVSGATYTSEGYIQSLQSALDKAGL